MIRTERFKGLEEKIIYIRLAHCGKDADVKWVEK